MITTAVSDARMRFGLSEKVTCYPTDLAAVSFNKRLIPVVPNPVGDLSN
jgi:hypothetical protein